MRFEPGIPGAYSLLHQPPVSWVPYSSNAQSVFSKRLPVDAMSHLYPNSDGIARCTLSNCGATSESDWGFSQWATPGFNDQSEPFYYATASDPWYKVTSCWGGGDQSYNHTVRFHAPRAAAPGGAWGISDGGLVIWDQAQHLLVDIYVHNKGWNLGNCSATSSANACQVPSGYSSCGFRYESDPDWTNTWMSTPAGYAPWAGHIRNQELQQGQINHAMVMMYNCTNNPQNFPVGHSGVEGVNYVFPQIVPNMALPCDGAHQNANRPPSGALIFLDYSDAQLASLKTQLPAWQYPVIEAMSHYGAYLSGTVGDGGGSDGTLSPTANGLESAEAWYQAGLRDRNPFYSWLSAQRGVNTVHCNAYDSGAPLDTCSEYRYQVRFFSGLPKNLPGPSCSVSQAAANQCGVDRHIHMADPCLVKAMAGLPGGCASDRSHTSGVKPGSRPVKK